MKFCSRSFRALMRRNLIYRKRRWLASTFEVALPVFAIAILYIIKISLGETSLAAEVVEASYATNDRAMVPFSFLDYVKALQAKRQCVQRDLFSAQISGIDSFGGWPVPFVFCNAVNCQSKTVGADASDLCTYRVLALAPAESGGSAAEKVQSFKSYIEATYPQVADRDALPFDHDFIRVFNSNEDMQSYVTSQDYGGFANGAYQPKIGIAVVFANSGPKEYDYTIRVNSTNFNDQQLAARPVSQTTPGTDRAFNNFVKDDFESCPGAGGEPFQGSYSTSCTGQYIYNAALPIQRLVDDWILDDAGADVRVAQNGVTFVPFPTKEYTQNGFYAAIAPFAPLLITLGLLYPVASSIRAIVSEKELRQKELMKMMSISESDIGWSWFMSLFCFFLVPAILCAIFTNLLYSNSEYVILLIFWILTFIACIVYCFFVASISTKATRATLIGILLFFIGYFLPLAVDFETGSTGLISLVSLHPVTAYTYGLIVIGYLEDNGVGLKSTTISSSDFPSGYVFSNAIASLVFDSILWGLVSWYLNRILRGDYGTSLPWYFPVSRQYWFPKSQAFEDSAAQENSTDVPVESVSEQLKAQEKEGKAVMIHNLRKQFGEKTAVDGLNLSMYSGQITALLGHNGAGKTTTIGMLTGMIPPTMGYASVAGYDIRTDLALLRENVGICLQHDCLFPQLTVKEHIQFFSRVKGLYERVSKEEAEKSVMAAIEDVALLEKRHTFSKDLSGGMKRKLSVAIAFCGDSKVVFLDEPTSGMDPFSRRFTWNVIRQYRENRCIVLTTHFMDEADLLGDRIAIMAEGRLRCAGSSLFLKKHYGVGYQLTIIKPGGRSSLINGNGKQSKDSEKPETAIVGGYDAVLEEIVKGAVPKATILSNVGTEISFQLPIGAASSFIGMFEQLDEESQAHRIETYGVSITTLDEVFLMVARGEEGVHKPITVEEARSTEDGSNNYRLSTDANNQRVFARHVKALFAKRAMNFRRDKKAWICSSIIPTIMTLFGFIIVAFVQPSRNMESLSLSLDQNNPLIANSNDRNPLPHNNPGSYNCQPGFCIYSSTNVNNTNENFSDEYTFCGSQVGIDTISLGNCSISDSTDYIEEITEFGTVPVGQDVGSVLESSIALSESFSSFEASQYGAIYFTHDSSSSFTGADNINYNSHVSELCRNNTGDYMTEDQCDLYEGIGYLVNYNFTSLHGSLTYQAVADEAILRDNLQDPEYKIKVTVWPLPITKVEEDFAQAEDAFSAWFLLVLSFPFITGSFATFIVAERESKAKHLQTVAGVQPSAYWLSTYLWDTMNYQIPLWTIIILMFALDIQSFIAEEKKAIEGTFALLILFGPAAAGFTYILSFAFKSPSMCNLFVIVFNFFIGMAGPMVSFILRLLAADTESDLENLRNVAVIIEWILRFIPSFNLGKGLFFIINMTVFEFIEGEVVDALHPAIARYEIIFLAWQTLIYVLLAIRIDILSTKPKAVQYFKTFISFFTFKWIFGSAKKSQGTVATEIANDEDVISENDRVKSGGADDELIVLRDLTKQYPNGKLAVNHMSLGIPPGQCFGLLGINGAGKTTTMAMLTAEFPPTSGDAALAGFSVSNEPEQTRKRIGYCPQFDAHFANMTGREHVELYAAIKGVPKSVVKEASVAKLSEVGLSEFDSDRLSAGYSGGMKRKLSVACATIGQPQIVFLDEPSTGMDPVARRDLWKVISKMVQGRPDMSLEEKTSVILTTHSMEECEALCPRIGIMAGGKLRCLGSAQHLKTRFGKGYQIEMKVKHAEDEDSDVIETTLNLLKFLNVQTDSDDDVEENSRLKLASETFMKIDQAKEVSEKLTGDDYLSNMINGDDPAGYRVYKSATSQVGVTVDDFAGFCVEELRMKALVDFFNETFETAVLRERQDNKVRFEVSSEGTTISNIFAKIEKKKDELMLDDYGVSQTSLEQVFNMHAAEAEKAKQNTVDGV